MKESETSGGYRPFGVLGKELGYEVKCNIMQITRKRIRKITASYTIEGTVLDNVEKIKYLGITITNDLKGTHMSAIFVQRPAGPLA